MIVPPNPVVPSWRAAGMPPRPTPRAPMPAAPVAPPQPDAYPVSPIAAWLVAGTVYFSVSRMGSTFAVLEPLRLTLLFSTLAMVIMTTQVGRWRPGDLAKHWIAKIILGLLVIMVLGISTSIYPTRSFNFIKDAFVRTLMIAIMVWGVSRTMKGSRLMVHALAFGALTAAFFAIRGGRRDGSGRLLGAATYDSNDLALIINIAIPLVIWWMMDRKSRTRWLMLPAIPIMLYASVDSGSRGGFLGLGAILLCLFYLGFRGGVKRLRPMAKWILIVAIVGFPLLPSEYRTRVTSIFAEKDYNMTSPRGRWAVWKRGLGYTARNPLFGVGVANFRTAEGRLSDYAISRAGVGVKWSTAHNSYMQTLAELGVIGGLLFFVLITRTFWNLLSWRAPPHEELRDPAEDLLPPMLALSFAAYAVSGFFLSFAYNDNAYFMLAIAAAALMRKPREQQPMPGAMPVRPPGPIPAGPPRPGPLPPRPQPGWRVPA
jgi:O-antigen ligase